MLLSAVFAVLRPAASTWRKRESVLAAGSGPVWQNARLVANRQSAAIAATGSGRHVQKPEGVFACFDTLLQIAIVVLLRLRILAVDLGKKRPVAAANANCPAPQNAPFAMTGCGCRPAPPIAGPCLARRAFWWLLWPGRQAPTTRSGRNKGVSAHRDHSTRKEFTI